MYDLLVKFLEYSNNNLCSLQLCVLFQKRYKLSFMPYISKNMILGSIIANKLTLFKLLLLYSKFDIESKKHIASLASYYNRPEILNELLRDPEIVPSTINECVNKIVSITDLLDKIWDLLECDKSNFPRTIMGDIQYVSDYECEKVLNILKESNSYINTIFADKFWKVLIKFRKFTL